MDDLRKPDVVTIAVSRVDGGLTILKIVENEYVPNPENPTERILNRHNDITPEYIERIINKHGWTGDLAPTSWRQVSNDFINEETDQSFRNAWKDELKDSPAVDMVKARVIHKEKMREARTPLLEELDIAYQRADEIADISAKTEIAQKKQALRDVTIDPGIEAATTPEELKACWPECLTSVEV